MNKDGALPFVLVFSASVVFRAHGPPVCQLFKVCCCCLIFLLPAAVHWIFSVCSSPLKKAWTWWAPFLNFALLENFFWRSLRAVCDKFVDPWMLYPMLYSLDQDHAWSLRKSLSPPSSPQTRKWKVTVFWPSVDIGRGLW